MGRTLVLWVAVLSLAGLAATSLAIQVAVALMPGDRFLFLAVTSYAAAANPIAEVVVEVASVGQRILLPLAALSSAAYMLKADRALRRSGASQGFDVLSRVAERTTMPTSPPEAVRSLTSDLPAIPAPGQSAGEA